MGDKRVSRKRSLNRLEKIAGKSRPMVKKDADQRKRPVPPRPPARDNHEPKKT